MSSARSAVRPSLCKILRVGVRQRAIRQHVGVIFADGAQIELRTAGFRSSAKASEHTLLELRETRVGFGANVEQAGGTLWNNVRRLSAIGDDPMNAFGARMCCRNCAIVMYAAISPSSALMPRCGNAEACAARPMYSTSTWLTARTCIPSRSADGRMHHHGGIDVLECAAARHHDLPPPPSSAGVPKITTVPPVSITAPASAAAAPTPAAAMMLWPHA